MIFLVLRAVVSPAATCSEVPELRQRLHLDHGPGTGGAQVRFRSESGHHSHQAALPLSAMCGRLPVGKGFLHVCSWVGAAMCSACLRGSHDRWP
jgi:hypothetical protein